MRFLVRQFLFTTLALLAFSATAEERVTYFVPNAQGSPIAAMDEQGNVIWRESYSPYGQRVVRAGANNAKTAYTGKPEDPDTGLVYLGARWYDPESARFTGADPQGFKEGNPQSFGRYVYANASPYGFVDPDGEIAETAWDVVNVAMDVGSLGANVAAGNYGGAALDGVGLIIDAAATAVPGVPGGAGTAIHAARESGKLAEVAKGGREKIASAGGIIRKFVQDADRIYYRVSSGDSTVGKWLTAVPPKSSAWAQEALALPPGNQANLIQEVLVPKGTLMERSRAIPMPQWGREHGGAEQFEILGKIPTQNFGARRPLE